MNRKSTRALLLRGMGVILAGALACGCASGSEGQPAAGLPESGSADAAPPALENRAQIALSGSGATVTGSGASVSGDKVTISRAGEYRVTGALRGQIYVEAGKEDTVVLRLAGAEITNDADAAIHVEKAGSTVVWTEPGTENLLQSGTAPEDGALSAPEDGSAGGGALYARDDLTLSGEGSLRVLGYLNNGIQTSNNLLISGGSIAVEAANHGVKGKDSVTVTGGTLDVRAGGDGVKSDDAAGEGYGTVSISGGEITIRAGQDGVQAETTLELSGGSLDVVTGGGSANAASGRGDGGGGFGGWFGRDVNDDWDREDDGQASAKGLKGGASVILSGGTVAADCLDDAVHSNGDVIITGGDFTLASGDDGIHADNALTILDGKITVTGSYEGLEGNLVTIAGGEVDVTARDDGINAYGGQNRMGGGRGGFGGGGKTTDTMPELTITGGTITVNADGDGLDSNGNLTVQGGVTIIDGPANSGNGALDVGTESGGSCTVTGGVVLALGAGGMDETFGGGSTQCSFRHRFAGPFSAGEEIVITDDSGKELFRHTAAKSGSSVVFTSPELEQGGTYAVRAGGQTAEVTLSGVSTSSGTGGGGFGGGRPDGFGGQRPDRGEMGGSFNGRRPGGMGGFDGRRPDGMQEPPDGAPQPPDGMQGPPDGMPEPPDGM